MSPRLARHRGPVERMSLDEQLAEVQWHYLMWNVHPLGGPRLRRSPVRFIKHSRRRWGWRTRVRPRWRGVPVPWRWER